MWIMGKFNIFAESANNQECVHTPRVNIIGRNSLDTNKSVVYIPKAIVSIGRYVHVFFNLTK